MSVSSEEAAERSLGDCLCGEVIVSDTHWRSVRNGNSSGVLLQQRGSLLCLDSVVSVSVLLAACNR